MHSHIEFLGAPGTGTTTLFTQFAKESEIFAMDHDSAIVRATDKRGRIVSSILPPPFRDEFRNKVLRPSVYFNTFRDFVVENPQFLTSVAGLIESASSEQDYIYTKTRKSAIIWLLSHQLCKQHQVVCIDEGLIKQGASALYRGANKQSVEKYFDSIPVPDVVIHINAPPEICLERQHSRGKVVARNISDQQAHNEANAQARDLVQEFDCTVIEIENTGSVSDSVATIRQEFFEIY